LLLPLLLLLLGASLHGRDRTLLPAAERGRNTPVPFCGFTAGNSPELQRSLPPLSLVDCGMSIAAPCTEYCCCSRGQQQASPASAHIDNTTRRSVITKALVFVQFSRMQAVDRHKEQ
jgi:hypothetical protein